MCHGDVTNTADAVKLSITLLEESVELSPSGRVRLRLAHNHHEHVEEQSSLAHIMSMSLSHTPLGYDHRNQPHPLVIITVS